MRSTIRFILLCLVLLMVALISAVTAMRFAIHGREVTVPKLVGLTPLEADRSVSSTGLQVLVERRYYSSSVPEGKIMTQVPDAATKVRRGWQIRVAESLGPQRVAIPDVRGETTRAAQITIQRRGLDLGSTAKLAFIGGTPDQVFAQSPPPNASGVSAPRISLLIGAAPGPSEFVMPNFVGQPLANATKLAQAAGMRVGAVSLTLENPEQPQKAGSEPSLPGNTPQSNVSPVPQAESLVLSQSPPAGQKIIAGAAVSFEVSK